MENLEFMRFSDLKYASIFSPQLAKIFSDLVTGQNPNHRHVGG